MTAFQIKRMLDLEIEQRTLLFLLLLLPLGPLQREWIGVGYRESTWTKPIIIINNYYSVGETNSSEVDVTPEQVNSTKACESPWIEPIIANNY